MGLQYGILGMWLLEVGRGSKEAGAKGFYRLEKQFRNQKIAHRVSVFKNATQGGMLPRSRSGTHGEGSGLGEGNREQREMRVFYREVLRGEEGARGYEW